MSTLDTVKKVVVDQLSVDEKLVTKSLMKTQKKFKQFKMLYLISTANCLTNLSF